MTAAAPDLHLVFVYGTLRRGGSNHFRMDGSRFVSSATINGRLYEIDWCPGLVLDHSAGEVSGEVYEVDATLLHELDLFEGVSDGDAGNPEYRRVSVEVRTSRGSLGAWIWEWLGEADEEWRISSGDWLTAKP